MSTETPIACDASALSEQERKDHRRNTEIVFRAIESINERSKGYAFRISNKTDTIIRAGAFIAREQLCCPFFYFGLEVEPEHQRAWLNITGSDEVK